MEEVAMSVVDIAGVATSRHTDELDIKPFGNRPATHQVSYAYLILEPCDGSEPFATSERHMRVARDGNRLVWRDKDGASLWVIAVERTLIDPETGEQSVLSTSESVQVGDLIYIQQFHEDHSPRQRFLGRVKHISTCV